MFSPMKLQYFLLLKQDECVYCSYSYGIHKILEYPYYEVLTGTVCCNGNGMRDLAAVQFFMFLLDLEQIVCVNCNISTSSSTHTHIFNRNSIFLILYATIFLCSTWKIIFLTGILKLFSNFQADFSNPSLIYFHCYGLNLPHDQTKSW